MTRRATTADLVRQLPTRPGLAQEKLATRFGVTLSTINRWENGRANPLCCLSSKSRIFSGRWEKTAMTSAPSTFLRKRVDGSHG